VNNRNILIGRYQTILSYAGLIIALSGLLELIPLLVLAVWPAEWPLSFGFIIPAFLALGIGFGLWKTLRPSTPAALTMQESAAVVVLGWIVVYLFSAMPFMIIQKHTFTQSMFEVVSAWTTTGLSVVDVTKASHLILIWRSIMQFTGGAGLAIIMIAAITGPNGTTLSAAEGRSDQLVPHVRESAKLVISIYCGYAVIGIIAYWVAGMSLFDSINHTFAAISTGGFSTKPENIGHWDSVTIEAVSIVLMIFGSINFLTVYMFLHGKYKAVFGNGELRLSAVLIPTASLLIFLLIYQTVYPEMEKSIRIAIFETVSALTTTGFTTTDYYHNWHPLAVTILTVLMLIGGGTCSTAGGMKQYRVYLLYKTVIWEIRRTFLPRTAVVENSVWLGEHEEFVTDFRIRQIASFVFLYLVLFIIGSGIITVYGYKLEDAMFEFASALATTGLSVGVATATSPLPVLWVEILGMFFGRFEIFIIFVCFIKLIRDLNSLRSV
jgi:trk system potassium uptake protein TrkH